MPTTDIPTSREVKKIGMTMGTFGTNWSGAWLYKSTV